MTDAGSWVGKLLEGVKAEEGGTVPVEDSENVPTSSSIYTKHVRPIHYDRGMDPSQAAKDYVDSVPLVHSFHPLVTQEVAGMVAYAYDAGAESMEPALAMAKESQERWQKDYLETMRLLSECKKPPVDLHRNPDGSGWLPS